MNRESTSIKRNVCLPHILEHMTKSNQYEVFKLDSVYVDDEVWAGWLSGARKLGTIEENLVRSPS
jgi:hypothetical protein